jgi:hypothetical protein
MPGGGYTYALTGDIADWGPGFEIPHIPVNNGFVYGLRRDAVQAAPR